MADDLRQTAFPFYEAPVKPSKKRKWVLSPQQQSALDKIAASSAEQVIGIDEVGMGCLAGPVVVAAVVLPKGWSHDEVRDSKQLTHRKRLKAWQEHILPNALTYCVLSQPSTAIDAEGIWEVRGRLTEGAAVYCRAKFPSGLVVQDGDIPIEVDGSIRRVVWLPKADQLVAAVSAASILAKVSRDLYMKEAAKTYPGYGFETNVGYFSEKHRAGLEKLGPCPIHRMRFKPVQAYMRAKDSSSW